LEKNYAFNNGVVFLCGCFYKNLIFHQPIFLTMKKILSFLLIFGALLSLQAQVATPQASPNAQVMQQVGLAKVTISYARPSLKGRKMFGSPNIPYGKVWRTGANKVTSIELSEDVTINDKAVAKGKYALVTIPEETGEWTVILNKNAEQWGTYGYKEAEDVLRFKVKPTETKTPTETLTFDFRNTKPSSAQVGLRWENIQIVFTIRHDAHAQIMADIKAKTADADKITNDTYYDAADYYLKNNGDLNQALVWATKLAEKDPQSWTYALQGAILAKLGQCEKATEVAKKGLAIAEKENDGAEIVANKKVLEACVKK
jgi:Protein of unknown function (DUF2911)